MTMDPEFVRLRCRFCLEMNDVRLSEAPGRPPCAHCERPILLDRPVPVEQEDFEETVKGAGVPVLVDLYADWCGPCKMIAPIMDNLAHEHMGKLLVAKVDTDRAQQLAQDLEIRGVPTVILFRDGEEVDRSVGLEPDKLRAMVGGAVGE